MVQNHLRDVPAGDRSRGEAPAHEKPVKKPMPVAMLVVCDILLIGVALCVFALFHHVLPRVYAVDQSASSRYSEGANVASAASAVTFAVADSGENTTEAPGSVEPAATATAAPKMVATATATPKTAATATATPKIAATATAAIKPAATATAVSSGLGGGKFADKFTDGQVITTASTYRSRNVNVTLTKTKVNGVTYYVEDIYIRNIENLRTAFAGNTYGRSITAWVLDMAEDHDAIAAINGDYYGMGSLGVVIRNGTLYSDRVDGDVCVLFHDGTMKIYPAAEFNAQKVMAAGAYQAWSFGPSLLSADGKALTSFRSPVSGANPRTAIGYYEPGHYVFVVVDGRQAGYSDGMTMAQLASLFEKLGCKIAYNLDGGKTSVMTFGGAVANQPTDGGRKSSDIIYIGE